MHGREELSVATDEAFFPEPSEVSDSTESFLHQSI